LSDEMIMRKHVEGSFGGAGGPVRSLQPRH
jgi:hypothetical protein